MYVAQAPHASSPFKSNQAFTSSEQLILLEFILAVLQQCGFVLPKVVSIQVLRFRNEILPHTDAFKGKRLLLCKLGRDWVPDFFNAHPDNRSRKVSHYIDYICHFAFNSSLASSFFADQTNAPYKGHLAFISGFKTLLRLDKGLIDTLKNLETPMS